ncbi:hypothetical protein GQ600_13054 [Phytophthora cactorum]|nr:hypothetical protein GQ600_10154 [Phytophthora cactorum]KAF1773755.1 hypothetical protein GQ600_13054 [Phytophthora cactorum]
MLVAHATTGTRKLPLPRECYLSWESICWFLEANYPDGLITSRSKAPRCFVVAGRLLGVMTFWSIGLMGVMAVIIPADSQRGRTGIRMFGRGI